jgi:hypothetical protein
MRDIIYFLEDMIKAESPVWVTILVALFLLLLAFVLSPGTGARIIDVLLLRKTGKGKTGPDKKHFLSHPIYDYFSLQLSRLKTLDFGGISKSDAIRDMLFLMLTIYRKHVKEFVLEGIHLTDRFEFKQLVHKTILKAEEECEKEWHKLNIEMLEELARDYNTWHSQSASFARMAICNITNSEIYDSVLEQMQEILAIVETKFRVTMPDIEKGLAQANGKYANLVYKSVFF